jgi:hypothetical protein
VETAGQHRLVTPLSPADNLTYAATKVCANVAKETWSLIGQRQIVLSQKSRVLKSAQSQTLLDPADGGYLPG